LLRAEERIERHEEYLTARFGRGGAGSRVHQGWQVGMITKIV